MTEFSRPATLDDLKSLVGSLDACGVPYLLIGGYALAAHGYVRATVDIDIMVPATEEAGARVRRALLVLPEQAAKDIDPAWFLEGENIRVGDEISVDLMLNANGQTYEMLEPFTQVVDVDGVPIRTVTLEGLARTKRTMREKDIADLAIIERALDAMNRTDDARPPVSPSPRG